MADSSGIVWLLLAWFASLSRVFCQDSYPLCFSVPPWSEIPTGDYADNGVDAGTNGFHQTTAVSDCHSYCRDTAQTSHFGIRRNASPTKVYTKARCFCGEVSDQTAVSADQCPLTCEGDFPCGGRQSDGIQPMSAYRVPPYPYPLCFDDQLPWPEITSYFGASSSAGGFRHETAITQCRDHCRDRANTVYFAIRRNHDGRPLSRARCFCGEVTAQTQAPVSADQCPVTCEGDFPCGGYNYGPYSVYSACAVGKYGPSCDQDCLEDCRGGECYPDTGRCCPDGRYGDGCSQTCTNTNCQVNPCDWQTGYCRGGCAVENWIGLRCETCTSGNRHCTDDRCEQNQGDCIDGCQSGWYGTQCDTSCPVNCSNDMCDAASGDCSACKDNERFGSKCTASCTSGNRHCSGNECQQGGGDCIFINGCQSGYYGEFCDTSCPDNCNNGVCDRRTGHCDGCKDDLWFGQTCDKGCSSENRHCRNGTCEQITGDCPQCGVGWYGVECNKSCPDTSNCQGNCDRNSGACSACRDDWYGHRCENQCPSSCTTCDFTSARCLTCITGFYGESCEQTCPNNCKNNVCSQDDGLCDEVVAGTQSWVYAVIAVLIVALVVAVVVILVVCLKKRRANTPVVQSESRELGQVHEIDRSAAVDVADPEPLYLEAVVEQSGSRDPRQVHDVASPFPDEAADPERLYHEAVVEQSGSRDLRQVHDIAGPSTVKVADPEPQYEVMSEKTYEPLRK